MIHLLDAARRDRPVERRRPALAARAALQQPECPPCLEGLVDARLLACGQTLCARSVEDVLRLAVKDLAQCPECREPLAVISEDCDQHHSKRRKLDLANRQASAAKLRARLPALGDAIEAQRELAAAVRARIATLKKEIERAPLEPARQAQLCAECATTLEADAKTLDLQREALETQLGLFIVACALAHPASGRVALTKSKTLRSTTSALGNRPVAAGPHGAR